MMPAMTTGDWVQLVRGWDYENDFYALPGTDTRVKLQEDREYSVRCPDGAVLRCTLVGRQHEDIDRGHGYTKHTLRIRYGARIEFRGLNLWVEVCEVELLRSELGLELKPADRPLLSDQVRVAIAQECHVEATVVVDYGQVVCTVTYPNPSRDLVLDERVRAVARQHLTIACLLRVEVTE